MWALGSQQKYQAAYRAGKFKDELMSLEVSVGKGLPVVFERDEFPKPDTTLEGLAKLKTVYGSPTVTAGNAPGLDAGAAAVIIVKRRKAEALGIKPLATILSVSGVALSPERIAEAPAPAIKKALHKTVVGIAHPKWEERPLALVVLNEEAKGKVVKEDIIDYLRPKFAKWQLPDDILFVEEIPKTSVGKYSKNKIREMYKPYFFN